MTLLLAIVIRIATDNGAAGITVDDDGGPIRVTVLVPRKHEPIPPTSTSQPGTGATASQTAPDLGPIVHFPFEGDAKNGGSLGSSHDGAVYGDGFFSTDAARGSGAYDTATAGYILVPATRLGDRLTMAAWTKLDDGVEDIQAILSSFSGPRGGFSWGLNSWTRGDRIVLLETWSQADGATGSTRSMPGVVDYGRWHHVAVTIDRTTPSVAVYVDGASLRLIGSNNVAWDFADNQPLAIGRYMNEMMRTISGRPVRVSVPFHFTGLIDDLRVYNRTLTPAEIRTLAERRHSTN